MAIQSPNFVFMQPLDIFVFDNPPTIWNTNNNLPLIFERFDCWNYIWQLDQACELRH